MKKCILVAFAILTGSMAMYSQNNSVQNPSKEFVTISTEMKEAGKVFYSVDIAQLATQAQRAEFMEMVYAEKRLFPVSAIRENDTWLICGFESAISAADATKLLNGFKDSASGNSASPASVEKLKSK
jgi:hypothetical protein